MSTGNASAHGDSVHVLRLGAQAALVCLFVGPIRGILLHWCGKRSQPCPGAESCPKGLHSGRVLWRGYAPIEAWSDAEGAWRPSCFELTEQAEEQVRGQVLRGQVWAFSRARMGDKRSPVVARFIEQRCAAELRPCWDIVPVLARMYHNAPMELDVPNPMPAAVRLPQLAAAPPALPPELTAEAPQPISPAEAERIRELARKNGFHLPRKRGVDRAEGNGVK